MIKFECWIRTFQGTWCNDTLFEVLFGKVSSVLYFETGEYQLHHVVSVYNEYNN